MPQKRKAYSIGWYDAGPARSLRPPYKARDWHISYGVHKFLKEDKKQLFRFINSGNFVANMHDYAEDRKGRTICATSPEIIINAPDRISAQRAANLIYAAFILLTAELPYQEGIDAIPLDPSDLEGILPEDYDLALSERFSAPGIAKSARCAVKATRKKIWTHALIKHQVSLKISSMPAMDTHPEYGNLYGIENDPASYVLFAQSIVTAFSVIEELGLEVRASQRKPSLIDGKWNPVVLSDLEGRLKNAGIDALGNMIWLLRGSPTRIERERAAPTGSAARWAYGPIRDREIPVVNAIAYASWLRSKVSAHRLSKLTASLTIYDVSNVQHLARRLLMETLGFWKTD